MMTGPMDCAHRHTPIAPIRRMAHRTQCNALYLVVILIGPGCSPSLPTAVPVASAPALTAPPIVFPTERATPSPIPPVLTPTLECPNSAFQILDLTYPGHLVPNEIRLRAFLPPCATADSGPYPVVILFHGKPFDETHWDEIGLDEVAGQMLEVGDLPGAIFVMPLIPEPLFSQTDGGPGSYEEEVLEGLVPFIAGRWPVAPYPDWWSLGGISRGGVWALEIGFRHPEVFQSVAALSPALVVNQAREAYEPLALVRAGVELPARIFLGAGETDWALPRTEALSQLLVGGPAELQYVVVPGGHETGTWTSLAAPLLSFLFVP